jgi:hypothetical protein
MDRHAWQRARSAAHVAGVIGDFSAMLDAWVDAVIVEVERDILISRLETNDPLASAEPHVPLIPDGVDPIRANYTHALLTRKAA